MYCITILWLLSCLDIQYSIYFSGTLTATASSTEFLVYLHRKLRPLFVIREGKVNQAAVVWLGPGVSPGNVGIFREPIFLFLAVVLPTDNRIERLCGDSEGRTEAVGLPAFLFSACTREMKHTVHQCP